MRISLPLLTVLVLLIAAASAGASSGPCGAGDGGRPCLFETGTVTAVDDGDTIDVDLAGDGRRRSYPVRLRAVQAMELTRRPPDPRQRRGECHAVEAADRVERLIRQARRRVRLSTQKPSVDGQGRLLRWVAIRRQGRWVDLGTVLMREGHALWMANTGDTAFNARYNRLGQRAAAAGRGLWDTTHCGAGPQQELPIRVWAQWDPAGWDTPGGEWIKVRNRGAEALRLGGWWLRDAMLRRFTFPPGAVVAPGATITVHVGSGAGSASELFWGQARTVFENAGDERHLGDGAYLFDPQGDLRAWMLYPCAVDCRDPYQGALGIVAEPRRGERVEVTNRSGLAVDLTGYALGIRGSTYPFGDGTTLAPGQRLTVYMQGDPAADRDGVRHWGLDRPVLPDRGGWARVATFSGITLACDDWGEGRCG